MISMQELQTTDTYAKLEIKDLKIREVAQLPSNHGN
jgi:hypothetical protein